MTDQNPDVPTDADLNDVLDNPEPPAKPAEVAANGGGDTPSTEKTYTQVELNELLDSKDKSWQKRYGGVDSKLSETTKQVKELQVALAAQEEATQRAREDALLGKIAEEDGPVDATKKAIDLARQARERTDKLNELERSLKEREAIVDTAGKNKKAYDLAKEFGLDAKAIDDLLEETTPELMEVKALRLALEAKDAAAIPATETDTLKKGQPSVNIESLSLEERLSLAVAGKI